MSRNKEGNFIRRYINCFLEQTINKIHCTPVLFRDRAVSECPLLSLTTSPVSLIAYFYDKLFL